MRSRQRKSNIVRNNFDKKKSYKLPDGRLSHTEQIVHVDARMTFHFDGLLCNRPMGTTKGAEDEQYMQKLRPKIFPFAKLKAIFIRCDGNSIPMFLIMAIIMMRQWNDNDTIRIFPPNKYFYCKSWTKCTYGGTVATMVNVDWRRRRSEAIYTCDFVPHRRICCFFKAIRLRIASGVFIERAVLIKRSKCTCTENEWTCWRERVYISVANLRHLAHTHTQRAAYMTIAKMKLRTIWYGRVSLWHYCRTFRTKRSQHEKYIWTILMARQNETRLHCCTKPSR